MSPQPSALAKLVQTALRQEGLSGLSEMLHVVADLASGYGCVLWQFHQRDADSKMGGHFFVVAQWFPRFTPYASHDLSATSDVGTAVFTASPVVSGFPLREADHPFVVHEKLVGACTLPLTFVDGALGALSVYRTTSDRFDEARIGFTHTGALPNSSRQAQLRPSEGLESKPERQRCQTKEWAVSRATDEGSR